MAIQVSNKSETRLKPREVIMGVMALKYGKIIKETVGLDFKVIPGNKNKGKSLYYSGDEPDPETQLRQITFQNYGAGNQILT